jgi:hypothetical protein
MCHAGGRIGVTASAPQHSLAIRPMRSGSRVWLAEWAAEAVGLRPSSSACRAAGPAHPPRAESRTCAADRCHPASAAAQSPARRADPHARGCGAAVSPVDPWPGFRSRLMGLCSERPPHQLGTPFIRAIVALISSFLTPHLEQRHRWRANHRPVTRSSLTIADSFLRNTPASSILSLDMYAATSLSHGGIS